MAKTVEADSTKKLQHWPALDGIRGSAILLVALYHLRLDATAGMFYSVTLFLTLSGFLITTLLLAEREKRGRIDLKRFYSRRAYRLLPGLFAMCLAYLVASAVFGSKHDLAAAFGRVVVGSTYATNLFMSFTHVRMRDFTHLWTLAMEEQFYLLWPFTLAWLIKRGVSLPRLVGATVAGFFISSVIRAVAYNGPQGTAHSQYGPDARGAEILIGCAVALFIWHMRDPLTERAARYLRIAAHVAAVTLILHMAFPLHGRNIAITNPYPYNFGFSIAAICVATLIAAIRLAPGGWWQWILELRVLQWLGRISYGMYLWHLPLYRFIGQETSLTGGVLHVVQFGAALLAGELSYRFVEQVWLRRRDRRVGTTPLTPIG